MSRTIFTKEQQQLLRQNPYVYSVSDTSISLTKEFKETFYTEYQTGVSPRRILEDHGFDISLIGERRIWGISQRIREEYKKHGCFSEGYRSRRCDSSASVQESEPNPSDADELKQLRHEVDYLRQEVEFFKKISAVKTTRK